MHLLLGFDFLWCAGQDSKIKSISQSRALDVWGRCRLLLATAVSIPVNCSPSNEQCPSHWTAPSNEQHPSPFPQQHRCASHVVYGSSLTYDDVCLQLPPKDRGGPHLGVVQHGLLLCTYKREQSGHEDRHLLVLPMCWSKWRYSRVCRVNTVCRTWSTYILFWNRRKRCREMSVWPSSLRPKAPPLHIRIQERMHKHGENKAV